MSGRIKAVFIGLTFLIIYGVILRADIKQNQPDTGKGGKRIALCIGVSRYNDVDIPVLEKGKIAADEIAGILKKFGLLDRIINFRENTTTLQNILEHLDRLKSEIQPDDFIFFFFCGYGFTDAKGVGYLLPSDARHDHLAFTSIPINLISAWIKSTHVTNSLMIIDACSNLPEASPAGKINGIRHSNLNLDGIPVVIFSSRNGICADNDQGNDCGFFNRFVIKGLRGEADIEYIGNKDGVVNISELQEYITKGIRDFPNEKNANGVPYTRIGDSNTAVYPLTFLKLDNPAYWDKEVIEELAKKYGLENRDGYFFADGKNILMPDCHYKPEPVYPLIARKARIEGTVVLQAVWDVDGHIKDVRVVKSPGKQFGFDDAAIAAVYKWKCKPAIIEGLKIAVYGTFTVNFVLDKPGEKPK